MELGHVVAVSALVGGVSAGLVAYVMLWNRSVEKKCHQWVVSTRKSRSKNRTSPEKEKMLSEQFHTPSDALLVEEREIAHDGCALYNRLGLKEEREVRQMVLETLLGSFDKSGPPVFEPPFYCDYGYNIQLGKGVFMNHGCIVLDCAQVTIGDGCLFGPSCLLVTPNHPLDATIRNRDSGPCPFPEKALPIKIGKRCWFGTGVVVCPGVTIGDDCVVAAGAVVCKSFPESNLLIGGCPAKILKHI